jgi:hypothetical protein
MTLNDIVLKTIESELKQADVDAFCQQEHMTPEIFCDEFARHVAVGYIGGHFNYLSADAAIAGLHYHFFPDNPKFATSVFLCFDTGEYHRTKGSNPDEITHPLVKKLLEDKHGARPNVTEPSAIAERSYDLLKPDGTRVRFTVSFGPIYQTGHAYRCPVRFIGWGNSPPDIWGQDSLQAFLLAVNLVHSILHSFIERGGRVLHLDSDEDQPLEVFKNA